MSGIYLYIQSGLLALSSLFIFISYGAGSWWNNTHAEYDMKFTLWQLCTTYTTHDNCVSIKDDYLESVILTLRACMGIVVICLVVLLLLYGVWFIMQRRDASTQDHLLHARTVILALLGKLSVACENCHVSSSSFIYCRFIGSLTSLSAMLFCGTIQDGSHRVMGVVFIIGIINDVVCTTTDALWDGSIKLEGG